MVHKKIQVGILGIILLISFVFAQPAPPQFIMGNNTLGALTDYKMSYYSNSSDLTSNTLFTLNFTQSYVSVSNVTSCIIKVGGSTVQKPICNCNLLICKFQPNINSSSSVIEIDILNVTNPYFMYNQNINVTTYFNASTNYNYIVTIPGQSYQPMSVTVNRVTQSDYGVGYTPVTYELNFSLSYISKNMQMQVTIPNQVSFSDITTELNFYTSANYTIPMQIQYLITFSLQVNTTFNPNGYVLLRFGGMKNPTFLGSSSSFKITFMETSVLPGCLTCKVAELNSGMSIQSTIPGDVIAGNIGSSNTSISAQTNLSISLQFYAGIPIGGKLSIYLPQQISPTFPIFCENLYGFSLYDSKSAACLYNSSSNRIDTVNFITPTFYNTGYGMISIQVTNPPDTRQTSLTFETYDNSSRQIGKSRSNTTYHASPLPLNASVTKNSQQVSTPYNLTANITLRQMISNSLNTIEVVLPNSDFNLSSIICIVNGTNSNFNRRIDDKKKLYISFPPPCSSCPALTVISFVISNLINPAYINKDNQMITINTRTQQGVIQSNQSFITLTPSELNITNYSKPLSQPVGTEYNLTLQLSIPNYAKTNSGQIQIIFTPLSTYTNGQISSNTYMNPNYALPITTNSSFTTLRNSVQYDPDSTPDTISRIIFDICDGNISICSNSSVNSYTFVIQKLKFGYLPGMISVDTVIVCTSLGEVISQKKIDTSRFAPVLKQSQLNINVSTSMTNTFSSYIFSFNSNGVVFDEKMAFSLPSNLVINGSCSLTSNISIPIMGNCSKVSPNSISIAFNIDQNVMIPQNIIYTITLLNVSTPSSLAPLPYTLTTTFNGTANQKFTSQYSMQTAYPINVISAKSNYTINQQFRLSLTITPIISQYDSWSILLPKNMVSLDSSLVPNFIFSENATYYILNQSGMAGSYIEIKANNSLITYIQPIYILSLYQLGYLAQQAMIILLNNAPVTLGCSVQLSNRTVGVFTNMTITCDRNSNGQLNERSLVIELPTNGFNYTSALDPSLKKINISNPTFQITINASSQRIITGTVSSIRNLNYIPNIYSNSLYASDKINNIQLKTVGDSIQQVLGLTSISPSQFVTNAASNANNFKSERNNTLSGSYTNITVNYTTVLGTSQNTMQITLPSGQNSFSIGVSNCFVGVGTALQICNIIVFNNTDLLISLIPNSSVLLTNVLNSYPNSNGIRVRILTNPEQQLIEEGNTPILPSISLWKISMTGVASSSKVADISNLFFQLSPTQLKINATNIIKISFPPKMFTRTFNTDNNCVVKVTGSTTTYNGCSFNFDQLGWLRNVTLGSFGNSGIQINSSVYVNFSVTNSWTSYPFLNNSFTATVSLNSSTFVSQGTTPFTDVYQGLTSFVPVGIFLTSSAFNQSQLASGQSNILSIAIFFNGNIGNGTQISVSLPKDSFSLSVSNNPNISISREDSFYYYILVPTTCTLNECINFAKNFTLLVTNTLFVKKVSNTVVISAQYDNLPSSQPYIIQSTNHIPMNLPGLTVSRNSSLGASFVYISIQFNLTSPSILSKPNFANFGQVSIDISNNISSPKYPNTVYSYSQKNTNTSQFQQITTATVVINSQNVTFILPPVNSNSSSTSLISIVGKNLIEVPTGAEIYWIVAQNSSHILYASNNLIFTPKMIPMNYGLTLFRANPTVGQRTEVILEGSLPNDYSVNLSKYVLMIDLQSFGTLTQTLVNMVLFPYLNPLSSYNQSTFSTTLCNTNFCIYSQTLASITPPLQPIELTPNDLLINIPTLMNISSNYTMIFNLSYSITKKNFVKIVTDEKLYSSITACSAYYYDSITKITSRVSNLNCTSNVFVDSNGERKKAVTITDSFGNKVNITSLEITYVTPPYQTILPLSSVTFIYELPTTTLTQHYNFLIAGINLTANLFYTTLAMKTTSNYSITVQSLLRPGVLSVQIPSYISSLFIGKDPISPADDTILQNIIIKVNNNPLNITGINSQNIGGDLVNGLYLLAYNTSTKMYMINLIINAISSTIINLNISILNVINPSDNRIMSFKIYQHEYQILPQSIYGYRQFDVTVTGLPIITVYSGIRNATKIGANIQIQLDIETPESIIDSMIIKLSNSQVIVNNVSSSAGCNVCIDKTNCSTKVTVQLLTAQNAILLSSNVKGRHYYTLKGCLTNSIYSQQPGPSDVIYVGLSMPYQTAQTTPQSTTFIIPLVTLGDISIQNMTSSSNNRADYTNLTLTIKPQNWQNCDGLLIVFNPLAYIVHNNINAYISNQSVPKQMVNSSALFVQVGKYANSTITIIISGIINYLQPNTFTIITLKRKIASVSSLSKLQSTPSILYNPSQYGLTNVQVVPPISTSFVPYNAATRIIFPDNYASSNLKTIIAMNDYHIPEQIPTATLNYTFRSSSVSCSPQTVPFNKTIRIFCSIVSSGSIKFVITLIDSKLSSLPLTNFTQQMYVYPKPENQCSNVMCDVCSIGSNGNEYCFNCREGMFSSNGQCVQQCPSKQFAYKGVSCESCFPSCSKCYDQYDNSCLGCSDVKLVLDSGTCSKQCTEGHVYESKYCVTNDECTTAIGCRVCSSTGFCYQCLPDYAGEPTCKYNQVLPQIFFLYLLIPLVLLVPIVGGITCFKVGTLTFSHMLIYILSVVEFFSWIFVIPKLPEQALAMVMCALLLIRIITSIVAYETYYSQQITAAKQRKLLDCNDHDKQSEQKTDNLEGQSKKSKELAKIEEQQEKITHKERLTRFSAHFLSCDAYELLMNKMGKPYMIIPHFMPYFAIAIGNRVLVLLFSIYIMAQFGSKGDLLFVPIIMFVTGLTIILTRLVTSEKFLNYVAKMKGG